ncbi:MAG: helix-turn-helix transcriptional regulator, partial [Arcobacteraceae bacterium]
SKIEPESKGIYLVNTQDGLFIKKLKVNDDKVTLKSTNPAFDDIKLTIVDINVIGKVCGILVKV